MKETPVASNVTVDKNTEQANQKSDLKKQNEAPRIPEKKVFKAGVIDLKNLTEAQARDIGDARMTEDKEARDGNRFTRFVKRIWKHNMAQEYYRQKEISKVKKQILETGNLYEGEQVNGGDGANVTHSNEAKQAIIDKFTSDYANEILREEEKDSKKDGNGWVNNKMKSLVSDYASGKISEEEFESQKDGVLKKYDYDYDKEKNVYADNLLNIAKEVKDAVDNGQALEQMDFEIKLTLGKARESLDTEAKKTTFDKIANTWVGRSMLGQTVMQSGAIVGAYSLGKWAAQSFSRKGAKWFGFGVGLAASGAIEAYKEGARLERDRAQHIRESAKGIQFTEADMKRRKQMEENRYHTKGATEILWGLDNGLALIERGSLTEDEIRNIMTDLSDIEARVRVGSKEKMDLISYDSFENVEKDRTAMLVKGAELKVALRRLKPSFDSQFEKLVSSSTTEFSQEKGLKDKIFKDMKGKRMLKKAFETALIGGSISFAMQEVTSAFTHEDGIIEGSIKNIRNQIDHTPGKGLAHDATPLEALRRWIAHDGPKIPTGPGHNLVLDNGTHVHLPEGADLVQHPDGDGYDLLVGGRIISGIDFDAQGNLTDEAKDILRDNDVFANPTTIGTQTTETVTQTADEYMKQHPAGTEKVHFKNWMGNDTEMYDDPNNPGHRLGADQNELRTQWTGVNGTGVDANGDYAMSVSHMTNDGSFQGGLSVAAQEQMAAGKLEAILSVTKEGQHNVFRIPINPDGSFKILHDSPEGQMLFSVDAKGHAQFDGAYLQIANPDGFAADGQLDEQLLGALEGNENPHSVTDTVVNDTRAPGIAFSFPTGTGIEPPYPIPPIPRRPMERGSYAKKDTSKQGPAKDKGIEKVKDLQSKNPIEGAVDPLKNGAEDLTKNEKVPVTEADFDENIKNARAEEAAVFAEFAEWEKNRKTPDEKPPQDLEDRYAAAQTKVADAEKAKAEFLARTDNEPTPAPASSEVNSENPSVQEGSENIEQKEKMDWIMVEDKKRGFGITDKDSNDYFYDKDGQAYWSKDKKTITDLIDKLNKGEEIGPVSILDKEPVATPEPIVVEQPQEQILSEKELEARYDLDEKEQDLSNLLNEANKRKIAADKAITAFTNKKANKGKPIPQKLLDEANSAGIALSNATTEYNSFVGDRDEKEGVISPRAIENSPIINTAPEITEPVQDQTNEVVEPIIETKTNETVVNKKESPVISQEETDLKKALDDAKKIRNRAKQRVDGQSKPTTAIKNALTIAEDNFKNAKTEYDNFIKNKPKLENTNSTQNVSEVISEAPEVVQSQPVETVVEPALNTENESPELEVPVPPRVSEVVPTNEFADEINRLKENLNTREYKIPGSNQYAKLDEQGNVIDVGGRSTGEWRGSGPNRIDAEETRQVKEMFEADKEALSKLESSLK